MTLVISISNMVQISELFLYLKDLIYHWGLFHPI